MKLNVQKIEISPIEDYISTDYNPLFLNKAVLNMFDFYLPMAKEFERIFLENDIYEWEAKEFWQKINQTELINSISSMHQKTYTYSAIKTLTLLNYLVSKPSPCNRRVFLYTSTPKLKNLCNRESIINISNIIYEEKTILINQLKTCEIQISLISEMLNKHLYLKKELNTVNKKLNLEKKELENKIKAFSLLLIK